MARRTKTDVVSDTKRLIDAYHDAYLAKFGIKPVIVGGKDGTQAKRLAATVDGGAGEVVRLLGVFFRTTDPRVQRSDYSFGAFASLVPHLRLIGLKIADERTASNVDAATRATQRREQR